jgi:MoxR-like ATPase
VVRPLKEYIVQLVTATRAHPNVVVGVSPRGGTALQRCAQALALLRDRTFATPDDIKQTAPFVMAHRLIPVDRRPETAHEVVAEVLSDVAVPVE